MSEQQFKTVMIGFVTFLVGTAIGVFIMSEMCARDFARRPAEIVLIEADCPPAPEPPRETVNITSIEFGLASWYGHPFHGRTTASGERYDMGDYTAASRTLRLGTLALVENLDNGRHVIVRVTDRGPYVDGRVVDLSHRAADRIGMIEPGLASVRVVGFEIED